MRKSDFYLLFVLTGAVFLIGLVVLTPLFRAERSRDVRDQGRRLVRELGLTDLCLFTEARYTRHITQTDLYSAFQDHPMSIEHFPSGSIVSPPYSLRDGQQ